LYDGGGFDTLADINGLIFSTFCRCPDSPASLLKAVADHSESSTFETCGTAAKGSWQVFEKEFQQKAEKRKKE